MTSNNGRSDNETKTLVSPSGKVLVFPKSTIFDANNHSVEGKGDNKERKTENDDDDDEVHDHNVLVRHVSLELLNPVYECRTRKSSIVVAIVNLVATVCGGGVLSLPYAFRRAGIIPTTLFMIYGMLTTDFSLYILVSCARRTGGRSYGDVAKAAYGNAAEVGTTAFLALLLIGSLTAYLVLVKDIWTPVVLSLLPSKLRDPLIINPPRSYSSTEEEFIPSEEGSAVILLCILIIGSPLLLKHDLHALRHTCYVGFSSCCILMVAVVYRAIQAVLVKAKCDGYETASERDGPAINWYSTDVADLAFAFPIVVLCFLCSYNVLGVHSSLLNPTRERMRFVLDTSMLICFFLFYLVGLGGYLYAMDATRDNILLNFPLKDPAILLGRVGFCFTLLFGLPLVTLPCREAFRLLPSQIITWKVDAALAKEFSEVDKRRQEGAHLVINGVDFDEQEPLLVTDDPEKQHTTMLTYGATHSMEHVLGVTGSIDYSTESATDEERSLESSRSNEPLLVPIKNSEEDDDDTTCEAFFHCGTTMLIVGFCYIAAISVPGVGFVWSLCGSSMAMLIAFIVPTACYLKIREHKNFNPRSFVAAMLLVISLVASAICTRQALQQ